MELNINMNLSWQKNKLLSLSGEYAGMQMSAADVTAMGALSGAGQHGGYNNVVYQIVGQPLVCSICLIARDSWKMATDIIVMTSKTWIRMEPLI